jgi:hypothetical protein
MEFEDLHEDAETTAAAAAAAAYSAAQQRALAAAQQQHHQAHHAAWAEPAARRGCSEEGEADAGALWLAARPQRGIDVFPRGAPETFAETETFGISADLGSLMRAYMAALRRGTRHRTYRPARTTLWTVKDALARLAVLVGTLPDWSDFIHFLPDWVVSPLERRAAVASTLIAGLEMAKSGTVRLRQDDAFGPILLRRLAFGPDALDNDPQDTGAPDTGAPDIGAKNTDAKNTDAKNTDAKNAGPNQDDTHGR